MIIAENGAKTRRYLSIISSQLVLVEPHSRFLGWGVCKLSCYLQDAEVNNYINFCVYICFKYIIFRLQKLTMKLKHCTLLCIIQSTK